MLNLLDHSSLDINYDLETDALLYGEQVRYGQKQKITLRQLSPVLLNKSLTYPEFVYEEYNGVFLDGEAESARPAHAYDIFHLPPGLLGIEYIKTHVYYSMQEDSDGISSIVEVLYGQLSIILQKNQPKSCSCPFPKIDEAYLVRLRQGERFVIPNGYYYNFVNTSDNPVIFSRAYRNYSLADYEAIKREKGLGYYCIRKNGREEIVQNPFYRNSPQIQETDCEFCLVKHNLNTKMSLYDLIRKQLKVLVKEITSP
jgi:oxalate decarboxylase/phosphoglucose isomerase-like protein (cupin superfamily)